MAKNLNTEVDDLAMAIAIYMLGFSSYVGFASVYGDEQINDESAMIKRVYEYAKRMCNK